MSLKKKIKILQNISRKTNPFIYVIQIFWGKIFKKPLFRKIKFHEIIYNTTDYDDVLHLNEYLQNYYDIDNIKKIGICLDIGANSGDFSIMVAKECKTVFAFEPITFVHDKITINLKENNIKNIKTYNLGVSSTNGVAKLLIPKNHTGGSKISDNGDYEIKTISWSKLYELIGKPKQIDLLKMDCEGSEYSLLDDSEILNYIKEIRMEIHIKQETDKIKSIELQKLFYSKGFILYKSAKFDLNNFGNWEMYFKKS